MKTFVGIDVGGPRKGFHAVALRRRQFDAAAFTELRELLKWIAYQKPAAIAIDAPCHWSIEGGSRECERTLRVADERISCFSTPTKKRAAGRPFYDWVRHGLRLYKALEAHYPIYKGGKPSAPLLCETFPQAVACMLAGRKVSARHKSRVRRQVLRDAGYEPVGLRNIDEVDAALCAITAAALVRGRFATFGRNEDGYIITPLA